MKNGIAVLKVSAPRSLCQKIFFNRFLGQFYITYHIMVYEYTCQPLPSIANQFIFLFPPLTVRWIDFLSHVFSICMLSDGISRKIKKNRFLPISFVVTALFQHGLYVGPLMSVCLVVRLSVWLTICAFKCEIYYSQSGKFRTVDLDAEIITVTL